MSNKRKKVITAVDMFCGSGGTSTGLMKAADSEGVEVRLIAINHWDIAIQTHTANHPHATHLCSGIDSVDPRKLIPSGKLDLLVASPECTHHSIARGGKPINDQSRASAWRIVEWAGQIEIDRILIENVKEFRTWGPLGTNGRPLKRRKGETYHAFLNALRSLGYTVEDRVLNAADYGDPTSRERLFIQARRGKKPIVWPAPTHGAQPKEAKAASPTLFEKSPVPRRPHRTAREIIDWSLPGESIFTRKRPLSPNTLNRILKGLQKFAGLPFFVGAGGPQGAGRPSAVDEPIGTLTTENHRALVTPFLVKYYGGHDAASVDAPLPAVTANYEHYGLCQPFIVQFHNNQDARSIDDPLSTIATSGAHHGLCQPFIINCGGREITPRSTEQPLNTVVTRDHLGIVQPFIIAMEHGGHVRSIDKPLNTITTARGGAHGVVQPFIIPVNHGKDERSHDIDKPMPTVTTIDAWALIEPYLIKYNGTGGPMPVDEPLDTVTAKDRFGLVEPSIENQQDGQYAILDIRFRMLQPHELAAAMSFPKTYHFVGNREQKVKQIGNAVPVGLAQALCASALQ